MNFKKIISKSLCVTLLSVSFLAGSSNVSAAEEKTITDYNNSIFAESETTQKLAETAANSVVVADKGVNTSLRSLNSTASTGTYPTRRGVILVTADCYKGLIPTGHAAIVASSTEVIESLSDGVQYGLNNWYITKDTCYGVTCGSTSVNQDSCTVNRIEQQGYIGLPYNYNYLNVATRSKFYCSQLVWAAYKDALGIDLNTSTYGDAVHPLELVDTSKTVTIYSK